jgi:hypothetical protein
MAIHNYLAAASIAVAVIATAGHAQQPPVAMPSVPPHNCVKPELLNSLASNLQIRQFNNSYKIYAECIKKYIDDTKVLSEAAIAAGNKAVEEFNAFSAEIKKQNEALKQ